MASRPATHAGSWYADDAATLSGELEGWLAAARSGGGGGAPASNPRAVIAPHAGLSYSGATAAFSYGEVTQPERIRRVFILGPSHHEYLAGAAVSSFASYATPLGALRCDTDVAAALLRTAGGGVEQMEPGVDEAEHSLELHLPFIRHVWKGQDVAIVPILVGCPDAAAEAVLAAALLPFLLDERNLFVVSGDFCHWGTRFRFTPNYDGAHGPLHKYIERLDHEGIDIIEAGSGATAWREYIVRTSNTICGRAPIGVFLAAAGQLLTAKSRAYAQSMAAVSLEDSSVSCTYGSLQRVP